MGSSLLAVEPRSKDTFCENAIRDQLSRILMSSIFVQSEGLGHFLSVFRIQMPHCASARNAGREGTQLLLR